MKSGKSIVATAAMAVCASAMSSEDVHGPIPVTFSLDRPSRVTLVVEDAKTGLRVRNLVMDEKFPAGKNTAWWDGLDDHSQANVRQHGGYDVAGSLVAPGEYVVRGIAHDEVDIVWQFCPYMPNNPIRTTNRQGQWLSDHTPPCSLAWISGPTNEIAAGATLAEGAHSLMWLTPSGKKIIGQTHIGATYTGPAKLCTPKGGGTLPQFTAYGLGIGIEGELVVVGLLPGHSTRQLYRRDKGVFYKRQRGILQDRRTTAYSLAVYGRTAAVGMPFLGVVRFLDLGDGTKDCAKELGAVKISDTRGVAFDAAGRLYVASGGRILRSRSPAAGGSAQLPAPSDFETFAGKLDEPRDVIVEGGRLFVSLHGRTHQVWELNAKGKVVKRYGRAGVPKCGPYDEGKMHYPQGLMLTPSNELWVAEEDHQPKRISVWDATPSRRWLGVSEGKFVRAYYGPVQYGGGGKIDPEDPTRFYYYGIEMKLDWKKGDSRVVDVYARSDSSGPFAGSLPTDPVYIAGRQYMCNTYDAEPIAGPFVETVFRYDADGIARPVAMLGELVPKFVPAFFSSSLTNRLSREQYVGAHHYSGWGQKPWGGVHSVFAWSDLNEDGAMQEGEVTIAEGKALGVNRISGTLDMAFGDGKIVRVQRFTESGVPVYDVTKAEVLGAGPATPQTQLIPASGGGYARIGTWSFEVAKDYGVDVSKWAGGAVCGRTADGRSWYYPYAFRGLHASGLFPSRNPRPGELIGGTKLIGPTLTLGDDSLEVFALNANSGQIYLITTDGFFVAALFKHGWFSEPWGNTVLKRGDVVNDRSSDGEGFQQTITRRPDGRVFVQALNHTSSILEVTGLDTARRLPATKVVVTREHLEKTRRMGAEVEAARQRAKGAKSLDVVCGGIPVVVDGKDSDWDDAEFVVIDMDTEAALKVARNEDGKARLFAAWRTKHQNLLANSGAEPWVNMFKTGGAADIQIATSDDVKTSAKRLLMSEVGGKLRAILYEPKSEKKGSPGAVSSPNRTVHFDYIGDVSGHVRHAKGVLGGRSFRMTMEMDVDKVSWFRWTPTALGFHEMEIDPAMLGIDVSKVSELKGDVGILVSDGSTVKRRSYWHNKGTAHLYDAPEESLLHPELWGTFRFVKVPAPGATRGLRILRTRLGGCWRIDTAKAERGEPCCGIGWSGDGHLAQRAVGSRGYVVFRYDPRQWGQVDTRHKVLAPFGIDKKHFCLQGRCGDGLLHSTTRSFRISPLTIDSSVRTNNLCVGTGGEFGNAWNAPNVARWPVSVGDDVPHRVTCVMPCGGEKVRLALEQGDSRELLAEFRAEDADNAVVVQFNVTGSFTLVLEQDKYEKFHDARTDGRKGNASMQAMFFD